MVTERFVEFEVVDNPHLSSAPYEVIRAFVRASSVTGVGYETKMPINRGNPIPVHTTVCRILISFGPHVVVGGVDEILAKLEGK